MGIYLVDIPQARELCPQKSRPQMFRPQMWECRTGKGGI
jgi:hypothetical protein